ncbi:MAG: poly(3-hydroxybutyrate) depolymerase [Pseudomonadota bacterium]
MQFIWAAVLAVLLALPLPGRAQLGQPLPALNIDIAQTSLSGLSSGAFMAVQFQVAHSSIVQGVGIVAGGPYYCARNSVSVATTECSCTADPLHQVCSVSTGSADVPALIQATRDFAALGLVDDPVNLARQRVYLFSGGADRTVPALIGGQLADYYGSLGVPQPSISWQRKPDAGHTMPTVGYGTDCAVSESPFIGKCGYDAAGEILGWIYGPLSPARKGKPDGSLILFNQRPFLPKSLFYGWIASMDTTGYVYVPKACGAGEACRLHVALHGCKQGQDFIPDSRPPGTPLYYGKTFVENAGYNAWADTNHIVVLYPQAVYMPFNPAGCWDWWGYSGVNYANKQGMQISAIRAMVDRITSGRRQ